MTIVESTSASAPEPLGNSATTPSNPNKPDRKLLAIADSIVLGSIMAALDMTVVNVAIPTFQDAFAATYAQVAWAVTATR